MLPREAPARTCIVTCSLWGPVGRYAGLEHASLRDHPDRCPYHHRSTNELRSAFDRASLEPAGGPLLTNPEEADAVAIIGCNDNGYI